MSVVYVIQAHDLHFPGKGQVNLSGRHTSDPYGMLFCPAIPRTLSGIKPCVRPTLGDRDKKRNMNSQLRGVTGM